MALSLGVRSHAAGLLLAALGPASGAVAQLIPTGPEFQVNTYTTGPQRRLSVAADADGDFVAVWDSGVASGWAILGQRYDSAGSAVGSEFVVNTPTLGYQLSPSLAADADGDFVVTWMAPRPFPAPGGFNIRGRRYDSAGSAVGSEFTVNTDAAASYEGAREPSVSTAADGRFVVVWQDQGSPGGDTSQYGIRGRRYDSAGSAVGSEFEVNTYTTSGQYRTSVAVGSDGDFVVVWESNGSSGGDSAGISIQGQRYDSAGSAVGSQFGVNTYTTSNQYRPSVAVGSDGDFVVVWESNGSSGGDNSSFSIQGQRYDSAGSAVGGEFQVNTYTTSLQSQPSVAAHADGDFVVVWESNGSSGGDSSFFSVQGQRYDSAGSAVGGQLQVNTYTTSSQVYPAVAADADSDFVVVWQSYGSSGSDTSDSSIQGQRYTTSAMVPSLSPAALAGTALLLLVVAWAALRIGHRSRGRAAR